MAISGDLGAREVIRLLGMQPHPEGGHYVETFRSAAPEGARAATTTIQHPRQADAWAGRPGVCAAEAGDRPARGPLALTLSPPDGKGAKALQLGPDLRAGQALHAVVPAHHWQTAETLGAWTLVSCTVSPGFEFSGFEMAPEDWRPGV